VKKYLLLFTVVFLFAACGGDDDTKGKGSGVKDPTKLVLRDINQKLEADPGNADLYDDRARYYMYAAQYELALKDINKAVSISPKNPTFYLTLSDVYLLMGKPTNSGDALKMALSFDPKNNPALLRMAKLNLILKEYKTSASYIDKALAVEPVNPQAYFTKALVLLETGDTVKAVESLKKAVDQNQHYFEALMELGQLYSMKKDPMTADYFTNALKVQPDSKEALYLLGMFYQETNQYEQAIKTYTTLTRVDTLNRNAPYNIGYIYLVYLKDFPKAADYFTSALHRDPGYFEAYFNRGYAYELDGKYREATQDYEKALSIKVNYQKAIDGLNRLDKMRKRK
jgi:tetratricopeptide (TPR) repeat protein